MSKKFVCTSSEPVVATKAGKLRGFYFDGTYTFHGIQYADAKRFRMPERVAPWQGVRDALGYGPIAPLLEPFGTEGDLLMPHRLWPENEHCQYLNVWTGSLAPDAKKPVMVWLHGGGFSAGSSIEQVAYEGASLCRYGDVVVVSLNHRLNILGFLDLSSFGEKYANSGNAGLADIVEALRWIRDNISAFGGDPGNVTIFGQSGGGGKVTALCQIPDAAGLFHRAIVMSGVFDMKMGGAWDGRTLVTAMLREAGLGPGDVAVLETLPYAQLADLARRAGKTLGIPNVAMMSGPIANDWYPGDPMDVGFTENARKIPTMAGTVIAEFSHFPDPKNKHALSAEARRDIVAKRFGAAADELIRAFRKAYPGKNEADLVHMDTFFRMPTLKYLEKKSAVAQAPVYSYMFSLEFDVNDGKPAWHCADIPFAFHNCDIIPYTNIDGVTDRLEEQFCGAFVNFARSGDPNHAALPRWSPFSPENKSTMVFDRETELRVDYEHELMVLLEKAPPPPRPGFARKD